MDRIQCRKIFIEAMHGLGDVVCMLPMMKAVRRTFPDASITVMVNKQMASDVLQYSDAGIDEVIAINAHADKIAFVKECLKLRRRKFDISISAAHTPVVKAKAVMAIVNARQKYGIQYTLGTNYDGLDDQYHFVDANMLVLDDMGIPNHHFLPELIPDKQIVERFRNNMDAQKPVIGVCIGKADVSYRDKARKQSVYTRSWGSHENHILNMTELILYILKEGWQAVLIGGKAEESIRDLLPENIIGNSACFDYVGRTTLMESIALASVCDVVVGVDTGMQHISDAVGTKTVSLFGPTNPKTHGAYSDKAVFVEENVACRYCYGTPSYVLCEDRQCMKHIMPKKVFEAIKASVPEQQDNLK